MKRLIWQYHYGDLAELDLVYVDSDDKSDIRVSNLRRVSYKDRLSVMDKISNSSASDIFYYDGKGDIYWKVDYYTGENYYTFAAKKGEMVNFYPDDQGYLMVVFKPRIKGHACKVFKHRLVYELRHNESMNCNVVIDHIDGNKLNSHHSNLRKVTKIVNSRNSKMSKANNSGKSGVYYKKNGNWVSKHTDAFGRVITKSFSSNKYGYNLAFHMACNHRDYKIHEANLILGEDGYTYRHGLKMEDN